jgi:hypothetical protein
MWRKEVTEAEEKYIMRSSIIVLLIKSNYRNQAKENGINGPRDTHRKDVEV